MKLLDLPVELFVSVIHEFVSYVGVDKAWKARMVCRKYSDLEHLAHLKVETKSR
jgi:hypothetical protein